MKESAGGIMALPLTLLGAFGLWHGDGRLSVAVGRLLRCLTLALSASFELSLLRAYPRVVEDPVMAFRALGWHSTIVPTYIMAYSLLASKGTYVRIITRKTADEGSEATGRIFSAATAQGRRLIAVYLGLGTVYTLSTWAVPLLMLHLGPSSQTRVPYDIWFPVPASDPMGLVAQYVFQSVGIEISTYMVIVCDMFFISLLLKMIGDFKTLNGALARLKAEDTTRAGIILELRNEHLIPASNILAVNSRQNARKEMDSKLVALIQYHQALLRDVHELRRLMDKFLFVLYLLGSGNLCALAYEVSKVSGFNHQMTSAGSYLMGMVFRLGVYCYYGSEITSESLKVGEAIYFSDWLPASMTFKQRCVLVIARSQRPVKFTAGKFGTLSLDTYSRIINTAYSYFMLLRKMQNV